MLSAQAIREESLKLEAFRKEQQLKNEQNELIELEKCILDSIRMDTTCTSISTNNLYSNNQNTLKKLGYSCVKKEHSSIGIGYYYEISWVKDNLSSLEELAD